MDAFTLRAMRAEIQKLAAVPQTVLQGVGESGLVQGPMGKGDWSLMGGPESPTFRARAMGQLSPQGVDAYGRVAERRAEQLLRKAPSLGGHVSMRELAAPGHTGATRVDSTAAHAAPKTVVRRFVKAAL